MNCFKDDKTPISKQVDNWRQVLKAFCAKAFKKIRIRKKKMINLLSQNISNMIDRRNNLKREVETPKVIKNIEVLDKCISEIEASENREKVMKYFKSYSDNPESINMQEMWKANKKLWPKCGNNLPTAKKITGVNLCLIQEL